MPESRRPVENPLRIFMVGCPRSGTTLAQSLLAAHSQVTSFTESHFFYKGFSGFGERRYVVRKRLAPLVKDFLEQNCPGLENPVCVTGSRPFDVSRTASELIGLLDACARIDNATAWVEKTPNHIFRIPLISKAAPSARFVHVIRRPEGVIPSLYKASRQWGRSKTWTECAIHWALALRVSTAYMKQPNHFILPYEHLVEDPPHALKRLLDWLELKWEEEITDTYQKEAENIVSRGETWKTENFGKIINKNRLSLAELPLPVRLTVKIFDYYSQIMDEKG